MDGRDVVTLWPEYACQDAHIQPVVINDQDSAASQTRLGRFGGRVPAGIAQPV
jgi:hypothetical protein